MSNKSTYTIAAVIIAIPFAIGFSALGAYIFMLLWNWALVGIFPSIPMLDFWKAWGFNILLAFIGSFFKSSN